MTVKKDTYGNVVQAARPSICQNVAIGSSSAQSVAFTVGSIGLYGDGACAGGSGSPASLPTTQHVRLVATSDCYIAFGPAASTTATTSSCFLPASSPEYFWVNPGDVVAVIQSAVTGTLNVCECL